MESLKILLLICLLFNLSNCVNEANDDQNTFIPKDGGAKMDCHDDMRIINIQGSWEKTTPLPEIPISFNIILDGENGLTCTYEATEKDITCIVEKDKYKLNFTDTNMDENYLLKGHNYGDISCSLSSYIYLNILLLFALIFILFN